MYHKNLIHKINIRLSIAQYNELKRISEERKTNISNLIRYIIADYIRKY